MAAQVETEPGFQIGEKETLFTIPPDYLGGPVDNLYDIAPDDQRFLMARAYQGDAQGEDGSSPFILVQNFFEELKARVPN